jgi:hypothetical protein
MFTFRREEDKNAKPKTERYPAHVTSIFNVLGGRTMKHVTATLTIVTIVLASGHLYGKEPTPASENLKCYDALIGTWRYEGPLLEEVPDFAQKGSDVVIQVTWRRILNRNAVEANTSVKFEEGDTILGRALIGWNAAESQIVHGSMNSVGAVGLGTVTVDEATSSFTLTSEGIAGDGEKTEYKDVVTKKDKDTFIWRALERKGGLVEGPSPEYTFKRVEQAKRAKRAK